MDSWGKIEFERMAKVESTSSQWQWQAKFLKRTRRKRKRRTVAGR